VAETGPFTYAQNTSGQASADLAKNTGPVQAA
jgi:hypothetical protein